MPIALAVSNEPISDFSPAGGVTTLYRVDSLNRSGYAQVVEELSVSGVTTNLARMYGHVNQSVVGGDANRNLFCGIYKLPGLVIGIVAQELDDSQNDPFGRTINPTFPILNGHPVDFQNPSGLPLEQASLNTAPPDMLPQGLRGGRNSLARYPIIRAGLPNGSYLQVAKRQRIPQHPSSSTTPRTGCCTTTKCGWKNSRPTSRPAITITTAREKITPTRT